MTMMTATMTMTMMMMTMMMMMMTMTMMMMTMTMTTTATGTKTMMNKKGAVLIYVFLVIAVLTVLGGAMLSKAVSERSLAQKYVDSTQAFWAAEAGVNRAFKELSADSEASGEGL